MVHASNFSPGANALFALARAAGARFASYGNYETGLEERHHSRKKDAPSGTALRIAAEVREGSGGELDPVAVSSRVGATPDPLASGHAAERTRERPHDHARARNRDGFARGAVIAAERIQGRTGVHRFEDLIADQGDRP